MKKGKGRENNIKIKIIEREKEIENKRRKGYYEHFTHLSMLHRRKKRNGWFALRTPLQLWKGLPRRAVAPLQAITMWEQGKWKLEGLPHVHVFELSTTMCFLASRSSPPLLVPPAFVTSYICVCVAVKTK